MPNVADKSTNPENALQIQVNKLSIRCRIKREAHVLLLACAAFSGAYVFGVVVTTVSVLSSAMRIPSDSIWLLALAAACATLPASVRKIRQQRITLIEQVAIAFTDGFTGVQRLLMKLCKTIAKLARILYRLRRHSSRPKP